MELYLQFGYGMMEHCRTLIRSWGSGGVILSPRDLEPMQLSKIADDVCRLGGRVFLDPQFYLPYSDHERLRSHDYWPRPYESGGFWTGAGELATQLTGLIDLNRELSCSSLILPGLFATAVDDDWLARQRAVFDEARRLGLSAEQMIATIALSGDVTRNEEQIHRILDEADSWDVGSVYLVCEHPRSEYLVADPMWLANVLDLAAGFRLTGKQVMIGYCNQQMLVAACASVNTVASGTWLNVRSFLPGKFSMNYGDEVKKRAIWYYCPQALSEYKIPFLDIAQRQGVLDEIRAPTGICGHYAVDLFSAPRPSAAAFTESTAFRQFLQCLHSQVADARRDTFDETVNAHEEVLNQAEELLDSLHSVGVRGQNRDFKEIVDVNRAALSVLQSSRGPLLRRHWSSL
jgi:hypothetical protein